MARNKYPEETVKKILDVAQELFMVKGYEHTTMADIVNNLGGLTKGAIYHHFKSKEEILNAITDRMNEPAIERMEEIAADRSLSGLEKVRAYYSASAETGVMDAWQAMRPSQDPVRSARLLAEEYRGSLEYARRFLQPAIEEGIADGSMAATCPRETAEALNLLGNLWVVPIFNPASSTEQYQRRLAVFYQVARSLGIDLADGAACDVLARWAKVAGEKVAGGEDPSAA